MNLLIGDKTQYKQECLSSSSTLKMNENTYLQFSKKTSTFKTEESISLLMGTPFYKAVRFENILKKVTEDFLENTLQKKDLKGNYIFVFFKDDQITILQDAGKQISLFYDKQTKSLSNSLLQLVDLREETCKIDKEGILEKMSLGFNITEKTVFKDIIKITVDNQQFIQHELGVKFITHEKIDINHIEYHKKGRKNSVEKQISHLKDYFDLINKTFEGEIGDLGLSGGFDCRLLLALADKSLDKKLHLHTHFTKGVHESQIKYAELLAKEYGQELNRIKTTSPTKLSDAELTKLLNDNLTFFDGRSARHLGAYSQTYTAWYKKKSMGTAFYSLNGLGGEVYRDSYFTGKKKMNWDDWARRYLFLPLAYEILPKEDLDQLSLKLQKKIIEKLNWSKDYYDILFTHAYYGLIKMPLCNGNLVAAYNKASPFLLPFIEPNNVLEALKAIPYLGIGGQYQAKMMNTIAPNLAKIPNHYGGSFSKLGLKYLLWSFVKTKGSVKRREQLTTKKAVQKSKTEIYDNQVKKLTENESVEKGLESLIKIYPDYDIKLSLTDSTQKRNMIFTVYLLNKYFKQD